MSRDTGRTIHRNHQPRQLGRIQDVCRRLVSRSVVVKKRASRIERLPTKHNQPLWFLDTIRIRLWVSEFVPVDLLSFLNLFFRAVANEHGLASPFDDDLFTE